MSLYIEYKGKKILLDFGRTGLFVDNAWHMGIDLNSIDFAILSHAYIDHSWGFIDFHDKHPNVKVYARQEISESYFDRANGVKFISAPPPLKCKEYNCCTYINTNKEIYSRIYLIGHDAPNLSLIGEKNKLYKSSCIPDDFMHEQTLVFDTPNGLVIFNSCSNGGVINIIREVQHSFKNKPIYAYIGGFHIVQIEKDETERQVINDDEISRLCNFIKKEDIQHIYTGHCTGEIGFKKLKEHLGDRVHRLTTGLEFNL